MLTAIADRLLGPDLARLLVRLIRETAWEHRWRYARALVLMLVVAGMGAATAFIVKDVINEVFIEKRPEAMSLIAATVLAIFSIRGLAMYGQTVILAQVGNDIVARLQKRIHAHVLAQGLAFHADQDSGTLTTRVTHNANAARMALQMLATRLGIDLFSVIGFVGVMLWMDARLTLIALVGLPVIVGGVGWLVRRVRRLARAEVTLQSRIIATMSETVLGARVIRAFGLEGALGAQMADAVDGVRDRANRIAMLNGLVNPLMETMAGIAAAAVILYAGWRIIHEDMDVGTFVSFLTALIMAGDPARRLAQLNVALRQHLTGVEFIYDVLDRDVRMPEAPDAPELRVDRAEIRLRNVVFSYAGTPALKGFDLTAEAGKVTALVGPSGAGKSTVLSLIERFFDPDSGTISIDGQDTRSVSLASLRRHLALVTQDTFLFDASVAENIAGGRSDVSRSEIETAAQDANAHEFISALPEGYETRLGEGGARLSGGQRQRIAIARAMLRDAPVLLLDEATSALDAEAEAHVQQALQRLMAGRTAVVIAHRLATIRRADRIAVVEDGRVVEQGTHAYLTDKGGLYARLAALQFGERDDGSED